MSGDAITDPTIGPTPASPSLAEQIASTQGERNAVQTTLKTDGRVLARITDGIYRLPGAAIRELISNAYDADATKVTIRTDRPRFDRIIVEDDGHGMDAASLAHMLEHIGGSAKRSSGGHDLGVTGEDANYSPGGRRLIGKIGIGLFSVSQLTQRFQIVTKVAGQSHRTVASIVLKQFTDEAVADAEEQLESGLVTVWQEAAPQDLDTHGTSVILDAVRPRTKQLLQGAGHWKRVFEDQAEPPTFHIGAFDERTGELSASPHASQRLPWGPGTTPIKAFQSLVDAVWKEVEVGHTNPKLEHLFDDYLRMIWQLGLSAPLDYVDDEPVADAFSGDVFEFLATEPTPRPVESARVPEVLSFIDEDAERRGQFRAFIDEIELRRPVRFKDLPATSNAVKSPMLFVGHLREDFEGIPVERSGGPLEFAAYILWAPKIAPLESVGSLIRVHGASGMGYDETFMRYQVAETTRLRQITCELFVSRGLEAALNIDRESVNLAHPHVVRLTAWLHTALSRAVAVQKREGNRLRAAARSSLADRTQQQIRDIVEALWQDVYDSSESAPSVMFSDSSEAQADLKFRRSSVIPNGGSTTSQAKRTAEMKLQAVAQIIAAYGTLDELSHDEAEQLLSAVAKILWVAE